MLVWKCSSHQANLVVAVAIAGGMEENPLDSSPLCANLSRLYKYLLPTYLDEFTAKLRDLVVSQFELLHTLGSAEAVAQEHRTSELLALYGSCVCCFGLLRMHLLGIPVDLLSVGALTPQQEPGRVTTSYSDQHPAAKAGLAILEKTRAQLVTFVVSNLFSWACFLSTSNWAHQMRNGICLEALCSVPRLLLQEDRVAPIELQVRLDARRRHWRLEHLC